MATTVKVAHTPGPWLFDTFSRGVNDPRSPVKTERGYFVQQKRGLDVCELRTQASRPAEETKANARLIAAAPELLQALKRLLRESDDGITIGGVEDAQAAIAQATGE